MLASKIQDTNVIHQKYDAKIFIPSDYTKNVKYSRA